MKQLTRILITCLLTLPCVATANDNFIIVLDASNSMWGEINGKHKIELARSNLATLLDKQPENANIGLIAYGDRHKADCHDINTLAKPGESTPASLLKQATSIMPLGRSPISAALQQAADLGDTILLISDGHESCDADPCATVKALKEKNPALRIQVLGFQPDQSPQLHCIAENSGGNITFADDTAAVTQLLATLSSPREISPETTDNKTIPTGAPATLQLTLGASNATENLQASFLIYDTDGKHITSFTAQTQVSTSIPAGTYRIDALWGEIKHSHTITLSPGKTTAYRFDLGPMGKLSLQVRDAQQQPLDANFTFYTADGNFFSDRFLKSQLQESLPIGTYRITAAVGEQLQETTLDVTNNAETAHTFTFEVSP
jgi:Ca-activated chloride channel family protein